MIRVALRVLITTASVAAVYGQSAFDPGAVEREAIRTQIGFERGILSAGADDPSRRLPDEKPVNPRPGTKVANRVAATVNGRPVTTNEVMFRIAPIYGQLRVMYPRQGLEFHKELVRYKNEIIEDLVQRELLLGEFEDKGYLIRDAMIDQEIHREIINEFNGNRDLYLSRLKESGMTLRSYREIVKKRIIVMMMRQSKYDPEIPPTPDEINREYAMTKHNFRDLSKDKLKYKKIFIPMVSRTELISKPEEQLDLAERIADALRKKEQKFEDMAKKYSQDQKAEEGGDWPMVERAELAAEFAAILFNADEGQIIGPMIDPSGFTIVLVEKKIQAPAPPLSQIREQIDNQVRSKRSNDRYQQWVKRLRSKAIIKKYI